MLLPLQHEEQTQFANVALPSTSKTVFSSYERPVDRPGLLLFASLFFLFGICEIAFSSWAESITLSAAGFYCCYQVSKLFVTIYTSNSSSKRSKSYSYGLSRTETLLNFAAGVLLLFVALYISLECFEHSLEAELDNPNESHTDSSWQRGLLGIVGITFELVSLISYNEAIQVRGETASSSSSNQNNPLQGVVSLFQFGRQSEQVYNVQKQGNGLFGFGHFLVSRAFPHFILFLSYFGTLENLDTIFALLIVIFMSKVGYQVCKTTGRILLQTKPTSLDISAPLDRALQAALATDGVIGCLPPHFWTLSPGVFVGTLTLECSSSANFPLISNTVRTLFDPLLADFTLELQKDSSSHPPHLHSVTLPSFTVAPSSIFLPSSQQ